MSEVSVVKALTVLGLNKKLDEVIAIESEEDLDVCLNDIFGVHEVIWVSSDVPDPVFCFWKLMVEKKLADKAYFIFTGIDPTKPYWNDLDCYEGGKFGSLCLVTYDIATNPGVKPSQRGIILNPK